VTHDPALPGGTWTLGDRAVSRFGYGAMQLTGPWVMGPPEDRDGAVAVLREAVELGITHLDTAHAYGPGHANEVIREALWPYPDSLTIATKVGGERDPDGGWPSARRPDQLRAQVEANLRTLGVDRLELVHLRLGDAQGRVDEPVEEAYGALVDLQGEGLVRHLGLSNATTGQVRAARAIAPLVSVQNLYNVAVRDDDDLVDELARDGIAFVPFFPLGGFTPVQSEALATVAQRHGVSDRAIALAWLLQRSPNVLLIPGTRSVAHLHENAEGAGVELSAGDLNELDPQRVAHHGTT